jgi:hypothetical protein
MRNIPAPQRSQSIASPAAGADDPGASNEGSGVGRARGGRAAPSAVRSDMLRIIQGPRA